MTNNSGNNGDGKSACHLDTFVTPCTSSFRSFSSTRTCVILSLLLFYTGKGAAGFMVTNNDKHLITTTTAKSIIISELPKPRGYRNPAGDPFHVAGKVQQPKPTTTQLHALPSWLASSAISAGSIGGSTLSATTSVLRGGARATNWALVASGGAGEVAGIVSSTYDWCINLGAPSALVAGAVIATLYEYVGSGALEVEDVDENEQDNNKETKTFLGKKLGTKASWIRLGRRMTRVLLLSSFALEIISIFVTTVMGTMLLSRTLDFMDEIVPIVEGTTPLQFFKENFELEYLTSRITFLQGILNWIAAIALSHIVPHRKHQQQDSNPAVTRNARYMDLFIGYSLISSLLIMLAFYNKHMTFYKNYGHMLFRWMKLLANSFVLGEGHRFFFLARPMAFVYIPSVAVTTYYGVKAFFDQHPKSKE